MTESDTDSGGLGCLFEENKDPEHQRNRNEEYWYWADGPHVGVMDVTRDGRGRFVEFHFYKPLVAAGGETKSGKAERVDSLGQLFG